MYARLLRLFGWQPGMKPFHRGMIHFFAIFWLIFAAGAVVQNVVYPSLAFLISTILVLFGFIGLVRLLVWVNITVHEGSGGLK